MRRGSAPGRLQTLARHASIEVARLNRWRSWRSRRLASGRRFSAPRTLRGVAGRSLPIALTMLLLVASVRIAQAQGIRKLTWDESSVVTGFAITVDGVRSDVGLTPVASDGTCGCSIPAWFIGARHQVIASAYNAFGETSSLPIIVGPTASAGGPYVGGVGAALSVTGSASVDATAAITKYDWNWGDGTGSTLAGAAASHSYNSAGPYTITLTVTDADGAQDSATTIATITAPARAQVTTPAPGSTLPGLTVSFQWTSGTGVTRYWLHAGTTVGGFDLFSQDEGTSLSQTVTGLPTNGGPVHVRLWSVIGGAWLFNDYTYTAH